VIEKGSGNQLLASKKTNQQRIAEDMIDMDSVYALGYGQISAARLLQLEQQGVVESYFGDDGRIKFRKVKKG
jgi:hypothetical protein